MGCLSPSTKEDGIVPIKSYDERSKYSSWVRFAIEEGNEQERLEFWSDNMLEILLWLENSWVGQNTGSVWVVIFYLF